jgi:hypothetical protein
MDTKLTRAELRKLRNRMLSGEGIENSAQMAELGSQVRCRVDELVAELVRLERLIILTNRVLAISQPPINGAYGMRWWLLTGHDDVRMPGLVRFWAKGDAKAGEPVKRVDPNRIPRQGSAGLCADDTLSLAKAGKEMQALYKVMRSELEQVLRSLRKVARFQRQMGRLEALVAHTHSHVVDTLIAAGYDVDQNARELADKYLE